MTEFLAKICAIVSLIEIGEALIILSLKLDEIKFNTLINE